MAADRTLNRGKALCLHMIVKNEMANLERCLSSIAPYIACWVIGDTGSADGTQDFIRSFFAARNVPGELHSFPFVDFSQARNEALKRARASKLRFDYLLLTDADMELAVEDPAFAQNMSAAAYLAVQRSWVPYWNIRFLRRDRNVTYKGVTHEFLNIPTDETAKLKGVRFIDHATGSNRPEKYDRDIRLLTEAIETECEPWMVARYTLYLGYTLRDGGRNEAALEAFLKRAQLGLWQQEVFVSLLNAAELKEALGHPDEEVLAAYAAATASCPTRAEALHGAARFCRNRQLYEPGYQAAVQGLAVAYPADALFIADWVYEYGLLDELAVSAYWVGKYAESAEACDRLLREGKIPADHHERLRQNKEFAARKLREARSALPPQRVEPDPGDPAVSSSAFLPAEFERLVRPVWVPDAVHVTTKVPMRMPGVAWTPPAPAAGTELMVDGLRGRLGPDLERINLCVNVPGGDRTDTRPLVVWMHHDIDQTWVQWCKDSEAVGSVSRFVFVSYWQRERYLNAFGLPPERCVVLKHALDLNAEPRRWEPGPVWRFAYASTPFRGLPVLLDAWQLLAPRNAELHIWSSMRLYHADDAPFQHLYDRAEAMPGVTYHGIAPNAELRAAMRTVHFLAYPCTFAETACLAAVEAMAAGCRLIVPSLGALPETTGGYARVYPSNPNPADHAAVFAENLAAELALPWGGDPDLSASQQAYCATIYDWPRRLADWRQLIESLDPRENGAATNRRARMA